MTDTPYLHALAMRTAAVDAVRNGAPGSWLYGDLDYMQAYLSALPLEADHAALLREAVKLPEVAALVAFATHVSDGDSADYTDNWKAALAALQPFLALETP